MKPIRTSLLASFLLREILAGREAGRKGWRRGRGGRSKKIMKRSAAGREAGGTGGFGGAAPPTETWGVQPELLMIKI